MLEEYIVKDGKRLRLGYTTGSCAAGAAKAAAWMLLSGREKTEITLETPKGLTLRLPVEEICREASAVCCAIRKDSGDDPDATRGILIFARVEHSECPGVAILGGTGVGRVTKRGLDQPVGEAAINSVPRRMIRENVEEVCRLLDHSGGLTVTISAPQGAEIAKKTFNPRLGIVGGISILGTTGIVEPMSDQALVDTIRVELSQRKAAGAGYVLLTPGNYGVEFIRDKLGLPEGLAVQTSNFIGESLDLCRELSFRGVLLVGHIGKLVKLAGGMMNTHSRYGDCRMELLAAHAAAVGLPPEGVARLLDCVSCDEGVRILEEYGAAEPALASLICRVENQLERRAGEGLACGAILFSKEYGQLGETRLAGELLKHLTEEN